MFLKTKIDFESFARFCFMVFFILFIFFIRNSKFFNILGSSCYNFSCNHFYGIYSRAISTKYHEVFFYLIFPTNTTSVFCSTTFANVLNRKHRKSYFTDNTTGPMSPAAIRPSSFLKALNLLFPFAASPIKPFS